MIFAEPNPPYGGDPLRSWSPIAALGCYFPHAITVFLKSDPTPLHIETPPVVFWFHPMLYFYFLWYRENFYAHIVHTRSQFDMTLVCTPDIGVALPPEGLPYPLLRERAQAACATINVLLGAGLDPEVLVPTPEDEVIASQIVESFAKDEEKTSQTVTTDKLSTLTPASLLLVRDQLTEFGHAVVERAVQIRHLVTNKLLLESANPDPKIRIRALELLGKISDVGLFTERSEVTITHQSTDELKAKLREKFNKLRAKMDVVDVETVESAQKPLLSVDLDEELGIPAPEKDESGGAN